MNGELVGHWSITSQGKHEFRYAESWLGSESRRPISLSMPLRPHDAPYKGETVFAFFDNLLPDSRDIRQRVRDRFGISSTQPFDLLEETGRDCVGAIQLLAEGTRPKDIHAIKSVPLNEKDIANKLRGTVSDSNFGQDKEDFRISLAGAQEKTALLWRDNQWQQPLGNTPTTHIFKLPLGRVGNYQFDMTHSIENEWLSLKILELFGLEVPECHLDQFEDQRVLIVERFDRKLSDDKSWWIRLPQEDMCQVFGIPPGEKYESDGGPDISKIMGFLLGSDNAHEDRTNFLKSQLLFWILAAIDGHAKNFSVYIQKDGRYTLTPLYDVLSAHPIMGGKANELAPQKAKMAMSIYGKNKHYKWAEMMKRHWYATAEDCGMGEQNESLIEDVALRAQTIRPDIEQLIPAEFPSKISDPVIEGMEKAAKTLIE
ncbi:MAG: type II toxin-antitoxin system HipA family toxin [Gammaproteobacteria bacterium]